MKQNYKITAAVLAAATAASCMCAPASVFAAETTGITEAVTEVVQETTTEIAAPQGSALATTSTVKTKASSSSTSKTTTTTVTTTTAVEESVLTFAVYDDSAAVIGCKQDAEGEIVIPETYQGLPVTMIGSNAFQSCYRITKITIPDAVDTIGSSAFYGLRELTEINLPTSIRVIPYSCFYNCEKLASVVIPDNVTNIAGSAFYGCKALKTVKLSENLKELASNAFSNCSALSEIELPASLPELGYSAFSGCTLKKLTIKNPNMRNLSLDNVTVQMIYGYDPSTAKNYADQKGLFFTALEGEPEVTYSATAYATTKTAAIAMQQGIRKYNMDNNSSVNIADAVFLARYVTEDSELEVPDDVEPDVNSDGVVDIKDVMEVLYALEPFCLKVGTFTAKPGAKITVPVEVYCDKGNAGGQIYITYDPLLKPLSIKAGDAYEMNLATSVDSYPLYIGWTTKDAKDHIAANGSTLVYVDFEVSANAQPNTFLSISVGSSAGSNSSRFCDETGYTFSASYKNGNVFIN